MDEISVRQLAVWLASWTWPMAGDHAVEVAEQFGWVLASRQSGSLVWDTGLPPGSSATVLDDVVADVLVRTSDGFDAGAEGQGMLSVAFAEQVRVVSSVLGDPTSRKPGQRPSATWDLSSGATISVRQSSRSCSWTLTSPTFVEVQRDLLRDA